MYYILMDAWRKGNLTEEQLDRATEAPFNWITKEQAAEIKAIPVSK